MKWDALISAGSRGNFDQAVMDAREMGDLAVGTKIAELASEVFLSDEGVRLVRALMVGSEAFGLGDPDPDGPAATGMEMVEGQLKMTFSIEVVEEGYKPECTNPDHKHTHITREDS